MAASARAHRAPPAEINRSCILSTRRTHLRMQATREALHTREYFVQLPLDTRRRGRSLENELSHTTAGLSRPSLSAHIKPPPCCVHRSSLSACACACGIFFMFTSFRDNRTRDPHRIERYAKTHPGQQQANSLTRSVSVAQAGAPPLQRGDTHARSIAGIACA